jgi:hypothetical protein
MRTLDTWRCVALLLFAVSSSGLNASASVSTLAPQRGVPDAAAAELAALMARLEAAAGTAVRCQPLSSPLALGSALCGAVRVSAPAPPPPRVTVFTTLFRTEEELVSAFLADVVRQTALPSTELLVGLVADEYTDLTVDMLGAALGAAAGANRSAFNRVRIVFWPTDPGLYSSWSILNLHVPFVAPLRTNWNPDDRRAPYALERQLALLDSKPEVDMVSGPVRELTGSPLTATWANTADAKVLQLASGARGHLPRKLTLADFGRVVKSKMDVTNPPHNGPMFRKRLLDVAGGAFDQRLDPLSDWALWVKGLQGGCIFWHLESPLVLWFRSPRQYSATHSYTRNEAVQTVLAQDCDSWQRALKNNVCALTALARDASA